MIKDNLFFLLLEQIEKASFRSRVRGDIDMSFMHQGDTVVLTNIEIHKFPNGESYIVCVTNDGHMVDPAVLLRRGNGINYGTDDMERRVNRLFDEVGSRDGFILTVVKIFRADTNSGTKETYFRFSDEAAKRYYEEKRKKEEEEERKRKEEEERRLEKYRFNKQNYHWQDGKVRFRESDHIYMVDGVTLDSVTSFVSNCFPKFNADYHAKRKAEELGITPKEVLDMWERKGQESRELGTAMHKKIEDYYLGKNPPSDETFELFKMFANKIELEPYRTEWAVYDWEYKIAGTIDFVDFQNNEYIIYDWKRSSKLIAGNGLPIKKSVYGEKALSPIEHLDDTPYYHYALQLGVYKYILERNYNIKVSKLRLGIFHPSYNKPYILEMPYLEDEICSLFGLKSEVIF